MRIFILIVIFQFSVSCSENNDNKIALMYNEHKADWKIRKLEHKKDFFYYGTQLSSCIVDVKPDQLKNTETWILSFESGKIVYIESYNFKDRKKAEQLYEKSLKYTNSLRTTKRGEWNVCGPIWEWQFHYVLIDQSRVYLIGNVGNMVFNDGAATLETDPSNLLEAKKAFEYLKSKL